MTRVLNVIARIKDGEISLIQQDDRIGQGWMRS